MHSLPQIFIFCSFRFSLSVPNEALQTLKILLLYPRRACQTPVHPLRDISKKKHLRPKWTHHLATLRFSTELPRNSCIPHSAFQSFQQALLFDFQREIETWANQYYCQGKIIRPHLYNLLKTAWTLPSIDGSELFGCHMRVVEEKKPKKTPTKNNNPHMNKP